MAEGPQLLFLRFASSDSRRPIERLDITDFDRERVMRFLAHLETVRCNGIATRNARLRDLVQYPSNTSHQIVAPRTIRALNAAL